MTTVEKRRSGRKSGSRRKRRDRSYSGASSGGSFLDETDREVSSLTDKAFRSLCIGDEAVYNDSELGLSSPCCQRERQLAFGQSVQDREREELKKSAQENFSLRVQQYEEQWIQGGMDSDEFNNDPRREFYGERTEGRVSATFQHSFVETSEREKSLREDQLSYFSNGVTEVNSQHIRSRSRVSSLIRAFNSEGCRDRTAVEDKLRECNNDTSWDKSALMSIQQELSEFSAPYQHTYNSGHFPIAGQFSSQNTNFYSSEVAAMSHMSPNSSASLMRSSHSKLSMSAQMSNSNFFIHSEFSPFKVWGDRNRFPFKHGQISGFVPYSEFHKWYETPMYKELCVQNHPQGPYRGIYHSHLAPVPSTPPRSTSTSTMLQKASSLEKRCESELAGHYPNWKRTQSLGNNRLPSQRPSTASPTSEMSRRVQDTISSVKALQQKIKRITGQDVTTGMMTNPQVEGYGNNNFTPSANPYGNSMVSIAQNVICSNTSPDPFKSNQLPLPLAKTPQEAATSDTQTHEVSPVPVEHPPVRAESRGGDVRSSSYKSRAISLLFNLKDNRKRVKNTYSPPKFKGLEVQEHNQPQAVHETVIDIPETPNQDNQYSQFEDCSRTKAHHQHVNTHESSGLSVPMLNSQPLLVNAAHYPEYTSDTYQTGQITGYTGFTSELMPENCAGSQLANGQHLQNDFASFAAYEQNPFYNQVTLGPDSYRPNQSDTSTQVSNLNIESDPSQRYLFNNTNVQAFNEPPGGAFSKVNRYEQFKHNNLDYSDVSSQEQINTQEIVRAHISAWKPEATALLENTRQGNSSSIYKERENQDHPEIDTISFDITSQQPQYMNQSNTVENPAYYGQPPFVTPKENEFQKFTGPGIIDNSLSQTDNTYSDEKYRHQNVHCLAKEFTEQNMGQKKLNIQTPKKPDSQSSHLVVAKPPLEQNVSSQSEDLSVCALTNQRLDRSLVEVKAEHVYAENAQAELPKTQQWAGAEQPKMDLNGLIIAEPTCSGNVREEQAQVAAALKENVQPATTEHMEKVKRLGEQRQQPDDEAASIRADQIKAEHFKVEKITDQQNIITEEAGVEKERQILGSVTIKQTDTEQVEQASIKQVQSKDARNSINKVPWNEPEKDDSSEAKQVKTKNMNEKPKEESREAEQHKVKKAANEEAEEVGKIRRDSNAMKDDSQTSIHQNLVKMNFLKLEQCTSQANTKKDTTFEDFKSDMGKYKTSKVEQCLFKLEKGEDLQEKSAKLTAKVKGKQQVKVERDKVEQVKTELAKAKAELAKIKEKMRGEQREKLKNMTPINAKSGDSSSVNTNDTSKKQDQPLQVFQQREHAVIKNVQPDRGADDYDRLREKYGFINAISNRTKTGLLPIETVSPDEPPETNPLDKTGIVNKEKSKEHTSRLKTTNTTIKETEILKAADEAASQYIYSESSKEFKLWSSNDPPTKVEKSTVPDKVKEFVNSEKCDPMKPTDVLNQNNANVNKLLTLETKNKLTEHNTGPAKDPHFTPLRGLSNKDKAQIKQEILTSKIKAHAEKEISAIKEKRSLLRDGSKGSAKQILGIQSVNVRQRPPQEVTQKNENIISSNTTLKGHTETSDVQLELITSVLSSCSNTSVKTSSDRAEDLLQGKGNKKTIKSNQDLPEISSKAKPTTTNTPESHYENQDNLPEKSLPIPNNEQTHQVDQGKHRAQSCDLSEKLKTEPEESSAQVVACINDKSEKSLEITSAESTKENTQSKDTDHEDSAPSLNLLLGQKQSLGTDDSLHIMGIMVTVRERNDIEDTVQENSSPQEPEKRRCHPSSSQQVEKETELSKKNSTKKIKSAEESYLTGDDKQAKTGKKTEIEEQPSSLVINGKITMHNVQSDCSSLNAKPRTETQSELQAKKGVAVTLHAKNKVLAETQPLSYEQSISSSETKEYQENKSKGSDKVRAEEENLEKLPKTFCTENLDASAVISKINNKDVVDTQTRSEAQPSVKEDLTNNVNLFNIRSKDDNSASLLDGKRHESPSPKTLNQVGMSPNLTDTILNTGENNPGNNDVHIDCIAIRVVPMASNNDIFEVKKKQQTITSPLDSQQSELNPLASCEEKETTLLIKDQCGDAIQTNSKENVGDISEHNAGKESVKSSEEEASKLLKIHNLQVKNSTTIKNTGVDDEMTKRVNKSGKASDDINEPVIEGGYFQLQELTETDDELFISSATVDHSNNKRESPNVPLHKEKQYKEQIHEAFLFKVDEDKRISVKSSPVSFQDEGAKVGILENTSAKLPTNLNDGTTEGLSKACKGVESGQVNFMRKSPTETESALTGSDKQSSRDSYLTRERRFKEKTDIKTRPKERTSAIPEISALADYARLKVIVSEDKELNPIQEFPPNKKEGFFPLIHTRHSRRPVFTTDTLEHSVKEKTQRNKTETSAKVNKEPKAIIYPITEKEHQRTGMFKLGDKERQSSSAVMNNSASEQNITTDTKTGLQVNDNKTLQTRTSSTSANRSRNTPEGFVYLDKTSSHYSTKEEIPGRKETKTSSRSRNLDTQPHKELKSELEDRTNEHKIQSLLIQAENAPAKQEGKLQQLNKELLFSNIEEKREKSLRTSKMKEKSGGHLAKEERRVIQGEEEKQGRGPEAAASPIKNDSGTQIQEIITGTRSEGGKKLTENEQKHKKEETHTSLVEKEEQRQGILSEESLEQERVDEWEQPRSLQEVQPRRAAEEEQHSKAAPDEQKSRLAYNRGAVLLEQQRKAAHQERQRRARQEDEERKIAQEEQKRNTAQEKHQSTAAYQRGVALIEQQRIAAQEEQQRKAAREEQSRAALQEQHRRQAQDELQRKTAQEEQQRIAALEWHQKNVQKENQIRLAQEEQQRRVVQEEQQKQAAQEELMKTEHRRRAFHQEMQERAAQKEQKRRAAWEGQKRNALKDDHQRKAVQVEQQQKSKDEQVQKSAREMQKNHTDEKLLDRAALEEQRRKAVLEEQQSRAAQEKRQRNASIEVQQSELLVEQRQSTLTNENIMSYNDDKCEKRQEDEGRDARIKNEKTSTQMQEKIKTDTQTGNQREEAEKGKTETSEETNAQELMTRVIEKSEGALKEEKKIAPERMSIQKDAEIKAEKREEQKKTSAHTERQQASQIEKQKIIAQMDALQYYAITSPEPEKKSRERQLLSPLESQRRYNSSRLEQIDRAFRPQGPTSPSQSLPRSTTSSPAQGVKPSMFRVKDNTFRSSTFTKSVKPRFHKNFGEDVWGSQVDNESEKGDDEQVMQRNTGIPSHLEAGLLRHTALNNTSSQGSLPPISYQRPYSRRSVAFDEDDTRSVISTMSEDVESYATSAADLADIRGLYDYERPESACSFSSDVSRSSGRPPTVPPKSEKALRRAQRLTCRRIKKELSKVIENNPKGVQREDTIIPPTTITEVRSSNCDAVASPHFSPPLSLAHAPTVGSSLPSSHTKQHSIKHLFHASPSPHSTAPISLPNSSAHAIAAVSLPAAPKTVAHVPSSPILRHAIHAAPVTQYQVESRYHPLTQRKVLQDLGSGQYFVVDVPVEVKTKTFIDPETGKYVQLNVRESRQSVSQPKAKAQQLCPQVQLQPQIQINKHQQTVSHANKPAAFPNGYQNHPQSYELAAINSINPNSSIQGQLPASDSQSHQHPALQTGQSNDGHRYSPEKTPYMDTVNDTDKSLNTAQGTHDSFQESDTNNQLTGCSVIGNDNSLQSQCLPCNIIPMGELEDFMELSDW